MAKRKSKSQRLGGTETRTGDDEKTWRAELILRARHRDRLDEFVFAARRAGVAHRPGYAELVRGILDATLGELKKLDLSELAEVTAEHGAREAAPLVSRWVEEQLQERLRGQGR